MILNPEMSNPRQELAALVAKTKKYVDARRKEQPNARVIADTPMRASASQREAEALKSAKNAPAFIHTPAAAPKEVKVAFVSEAPFADESAAGKLLLKIIQAMGLARADAAICTLSELESRLPQLKPKALVALGEGAARAMLKSQLELSRLRGRFSEYAGLPLMPTHHPAELLAGEMLKRHVWEDMKLVAAKLKS